MKLCEAAAIAYKNGWSIFRRSWRGGQKLKITNSEDCCIVFSKTRNSERPRWNPSADDLLSDDWDISKERFIKKLVFSDQ